MVTVLGAMIVFLVYTVISGYVSTQESKNEFLKQKKVPFLIEIEQIKRLKEQTQALLARKQVIESLQRDRAEAVRLLSELVKQMPEGVYIRSLGRKGWLSWRLRAVKCKGVNVDAAILRLRRGWKTLV